MLRILASFLSDRKMTVKVGMSNSNKRNVNAGAPQGSVLGTYIFNVATDDLEEDPPSLEANNNEQYELNEGDLLFLETEPDNTQAHSTPNIDTAASPPPLSPITGTHDFVILHTTRNVPPTLTRRIEPTWREKDLRVRKFVDDNIQVQKVQMKNQKTYMYRMELYSRILD